MKKNLKYSLILLSICAISAAALALTNSITAPVIQRQADASRLAGLEAVSMGYEIGAQKDVSDDPTVTFMIELKDGGRIAGYILGLKGAGYGGEMTLVASYRTDGEILRVQLLSHSETPGLGKKAEDEGYMAKFEGTGAAQAVPTNKSMLDAGDAAAVSGSTVTFVAIGKALEAGSRYVTGLGGK
ncbi:MAG: FMN-binding protein [Spirochaetales bacterium]|nr:FMN-binding protein [Spirochaetales bacterium]